MPTSTDRAGLDILQELANQAQDAAMENFAQLVKEAPDDQRTLINTLATIGGCIMHLQNQQSTIIDLLYVLTQPPKQQAATTEAPVPAG